MFCPQTSVNMSAQVSLNSAYKPQWNKLILVSKKAKNHFFSYISKLDISKDKCSVGPFGRFLHFSGLYSAQKAKMAQESIKKTFECGHF